METELRVALYFAQNDAPHAVAGMGWYLAATYPDDEGNIVEVIPRVRISPQEAEKIGKVLDNFTNGKEMNWAEGANYRRTDRPLHSIISSANARAADLAAIALEQAEQLAARIEYLRARAEEWKK